MKRITTGALSVLMVLTMLFALAGCGSDSDKLVGTWEANVDCGDVFNQAMVEEDAEMAEYFKVDSFDLVLRFTFEKDGTYSIEGDKDATKQTLQEVRNTLVDGLTEYMQDTIDEGGLDMTVDDLLAQAGVTMDQMVDAFLSDEMLDDMVNEFAEKGKWKVKGNKLFTTDGEDADFEDDKYDVYKFSGDTLIFEEAAGEDDEMVKSIYPIELKKVK